MTLSSSLKVPVCCTTVVERKQSRSRLSSSMSDHVQSPSNSICRQQDQQNFVFCSQMDLLHCPKSSRRPPETQWPFFLPSSQTLMPGRYGFVPTTSTWGLQEIILLISFIVNVFEGSLVLHSQFFVFFYSFADVWILKDYTCVNQQLKTTHLLAHSSGGQTSGTMWLGSLLRVS